MTYSNPETVNNALKNIKLLMDAGMRIHNENSI